MSRYQMRDLLISLPGRLPAPRQFDLGPDTQVEEGEDLPDVGQDAACTEGEGADGGSDAGDTLCDGDLSECNADESLPCDNSCRTVLHSCIETPCAEDSGDPPTIEGCRGPVSCGLQTCGENDTVCFAQTCDLATEGCDLENPPFTRLPDGGCAEWRYGPERETYPPVVCEEVHTCVITCGEISCAAAGASCEGQGSCALGGGTCQRLSCFPGAGGSNPDEGTEPDTQPCGTCGGSVEGGSHAAAPDYLVVLQRALQKRLG